MRSNQGMEVKFKDKFGEERTLHSTRNGFRIKNRVSTVVLTLNPIAGSLVGQRIKKAREAQHLTLEQLCLKTGLVAVLPKTRMWEIENNVKAQGIRFGTLYAIALALDVEATSLMPSVEEVKELSGLRITTRKQLTV